MPCCPNCTGVIEDEQHALFDCPMHDDLRECFSDIFHDDRRTLVHLLSFDQAKVEWRDLDLLSRTASSEEHMNRISLSVACVAPKDYIGAHRGT
jgi:hypothetical protein